MHVTDERFNLLAETPVSDINGRLKQTSLRDVEASYAGLSFGDAPLPRRRFNVASERKPRGLPILLAQDTAHLGPTLLVSQP